MSKTHKTILYIYLLVIIFGALTPYLFCWNEKLRWSLDLARTISIVSASVLALLYFDPFGIRKSNLARQHDNVIMILEKIFTQRIIVETKSSSPRVTSEMFSQFFMTPSNLAMNNEFPHLRDVFDYPAYISINNFHEQNKEFNELKNSLFTPKSISEKMTFLAFTSASKSRNMLEERFNVVYWGFGQNINQDNLYDQIDNRELTLRVLFQSYQELINECINWLDINSFSTKQLNIK